MSRVVDRDLGYRKLMRRLGDLRDVTAYVGVEGEEVAAVALENEFGVPGRIPERSFLRSTADENQRKYDRRLQGAVEEVIDGVDPEDAFGAVAEVAVRDVKRKILAGIDPPNAPATVERKGSSTPLVDTGTLLESIDHRVEVG